MGGSKTLRGALRMGWASAPPKVELEQIVKRVQATLSETARPAVDPVSFLWTTVGTTDDWP